MVSAKDADDYARAQAGVRARLERDLEAFFFNLPTGTPERARDELLEFMPVLVSQYGEMAAALAADWYEEMRFTDGVRGVFRTSLEASPYASAVEPSTRRVAGDLFTDVPDAALAGLRSFAGKYALAAGRETVMRNAFRDPASGGWQRVAKGETCKFCLMLVGRGAVYREDSAFFASHGSCDCAAVPSFDPSAPEVEVDVYVASRRTTFMNPAQKERHNENIRMAIIRHVGED